MGLAGYVARMGDRGGAQSLLVGKTEGKSPIRVLRRKWEYKIKIDPK